MDCGVEICNYMIALEHFTDVVDNFRANILLDDSLHAKLGDFGFCLALPEVRDGHSSFTAVCKK